MEKDNQDVRGGNSSRAIPPNVHIFPLSLSFFAAAAVFFLLAMILGIRFLPDLIAHTSFRSPTGRMLTHMLTLGWMTMLAMGASYQLVQVILQTRMFSRALGFIQFGIYAVGIVFLIFSLSKGYLPGIIVGGCCVVAAVVLYALNLVVTMARKRKWNIFVAGIGLSLLHLLITTGLGVSMGIVSGLGEGSGFYDRLFAMHLWFGLGGWMSGLILTFSFKLLPMFYLSQKKADNEARWIAVLFQAGIWLQAVSIWIREDIVQYVSCLSLAGSALLYVHFLVILIKMAKPLSGTVTVVARMNMAVSALFVLWMGMNLLTAESNVADSWTSAFVILLLIGWFSASILGYLSKIIPFLWWAYRFHTRWEKKSRVLLKNMVPEQRLQTVLWFYLTAVCMVVVSAGFSWPPGALIGQTAAVVVLLVYLFDLARALRY